MVEAHMNVVNELSKMSDLEEVHIVLLDMLCAIRDICDKNHIRYYLYCGTLLGCIRHGGFIPWDDDVDLAMPLEDYRRFVQIASHELPERYSLIYPGSKEKHYLLWTKICCNGTTYAPVSYLNAGCHLGVSIDVYPFLGIPKNKAARLLQSSAIEFARRALVAGLLKRVPEDRHKKWERIICFFPEVPLRLLGKALFAAVQVDPEKCKMACTVDAAPFIPKYEWSMWQETAYGSFEGERFTIPAEYHKLLTIMYGKYMELPPEEARVNHLASGDTIVDMYRDYREYVESSIVKSGDCN